MYGRCIFKSKCLSWKKEDIINAFIYLCDYYMAKEVYFYSSSEGKISTNTWYLFICTLVKYNEAFPIITACLKIQDAKEEVKGDSST